jgi:acetylxylan esterase
MSLSFANTTRSPRTALHFSAIRFLVPTAGLAASVLASGAASAASMQGPISGWQQAGEPSNMSMYIYVPDNVASPAPILVALHYCGGNASNIYGAANSGGVVGAANTNGFIILLPQTSRNCWDVGTVAAMTHGGGSDTLSIVHQVEYVVSEYDGNPDRVYAMGQSGGAMAVEGLLAVYPDVFKGGSEFSGVPAGCWGVGNMTDGQWSSQCANGQVTHTAQEWGDMVRAMYPDYTGTFRPRMQLWHGTTDGTINYANQTEAIKQWQNVLDVADPPETSNVTINGKTFNRSEYKDACGMTVLDVMDEPGGPHNTSATMTSQTTIEFLSLDVPGPVDPQAASECWTGGGAGTGGSTGTGGDAGTGGSTGTGGLSATGGSSAGTGGTSTGVGGTPGAGGALPGGTGGTTGVTGGTGGSTAVTGGTGGTGSPLDGGAGASGGCSISTTSTLPSNGALALTGLLVALFARRRQKRLARVS